MSYFTKTRIPVFLLIWGNLFGGERIAIINNVAGTVQIILGDQNNIHPARIGTLIYSNDQIKTETDGYISITYLDDISTIEIEPNSLLKIRGNKKDKGIFKEINLQVGTIKVLPAGEPKEMWIIKTAITSINVGENAFIIKSHERLGDQIIPVEGQVVFKNLVSNREKSVGKNSEAHSTGSGAIRIQDWKGEDIQHDDTAAFTENEIVIYLMNEDGDKKVFIIKYH